jgi:phosphoglucomutase
MSTHPLAGKLAPKDLLIDVGRLEAAFYDAKPDPTDPNQLVSFGTSGHRGSSLSATFTETHILAITQALCEYRRNRGITGPLFMGKDTHALSRPAERVALEVLAANNVEIFIQRDDGFTPTPVISRAILTHNRNRSDSLADGIVITSSHNPPSDGGFKYNPPNGGPADTDVTDWIQDRANDLLRDGNRSVQRIGFDTALKASTTHSQDFVMPYVEDLANVIDFEAIRSTGLKIGIDPLGGAAAAYWQLVAERYHINITVVNPKIDPTFAFMTLDHDGQIRMDCSSPWAMAGLVALKDRFDIAFGNDPDSDRHGLLTNRLQWSPSAVVGKTLVSSCLIDRVVARLGRKLWEVPVGFKWFTPGLYDGSCCFGGEESAGASFLRRDGRSLEHG